MFLHSKCIHAINLLIFFRVASLYNCPSNSEVVTQSHKYQTTKNTAGPQFNIKTSSYQYRKSHCGDKTVVRSSHLHNRISYTGKMTSLYWFSPQNMNFEDVMYSGVCEWLNSMTFLKTVAIEVHIVHISRVIKAYTLESLSSLTQITHNPQGTVNFKNKEKKNNNKKVRAPIKLTNHWRKRLWISLHNESAIT